MNAIAFALTAALATTEIPVGKVFVPAEGYDDNDNVGLVVDGELPDPCYQLGKTEFEKRNDGVIRVRQMAWRRTEGACGSGDMIDEPVPFTAEVQVGRLKAGSYKVERLTDTGRTELRDFRVDRAPVATIDSLDYAVVSHIMTDDFTNEGKSVVAQLSGTMSSSCMTLETPIRTRVEGDVIVALPVQKTTGVNCDGVRRNFKETVELTGLKPGSYLLHVRSRNGKAVNSVFNVLKTPRP